MSTKEKCALSAEQHAAIARQLYEAEKSATPIPLLTQTWPDITLEDAYAIQTEGLRLRLNDGETVIGRKIGITSRGMMRMLNCDTPDYSYLLGSMMLPEGQPCRTEELIKPMIEGELAFIMGRDLRGPEITEEAVREATAAVCPCFEVCDVRFPGYGGVTVRDTISDEAGAARFVLGSCRRRLEEIDPRGIGMYIEKNGELLGSAAGVEVMGSPVTSVAWLANRLLAYGDYLREGDIVLSGAFMRADAAVVGDRYTVHLDGFPPLELAFI